MRSSLLAGSLGAKFRCISFISSPDFPRASLAFFIFFFLSLLLSCFLSNKCFLFLSLSLLSFWPLSVGCKNGEKVWLDRRSRHRDCPRFLSQVDWQNLSMITILLSYIQSVVLYNSIHWITMLGCYTRLFRCHAVSISFVLYLVGLVIV